METLHAVVMNKLRWCWVVPYSLLLFTLLLSCFYPDIVCEFCASLIMLLQTAWSEAASSQLLVLMWHTFMSCLHTSLNLKCGHPLGQKPVISSPYCMSLGISAIASASHMAKLVHTALHKQNVHAGSSCLL